MTEQPRPQVVIDTETTGLDPHIHNAYEVGWAKDDGPVHRARLPHTLNNADREALVVGRYWHRGFTPWQSTQPLKLPDVARLIKDLTGATLVGANPAFDAAFLRKFLGYAPWHHRLLDVEAYAMAALRLDHVPGLAEIVETLNGLGLGIPEPDHTAAGDVLTTRAVWHVLRRL